MNVGTFELLTPHVAVQAIESVIGARVDGALTSFPSYVNRVYGFRAEDDRQYVAKFYRPGRWSYEAIAEEHLLVGECAALELPVVAPVADAAGDVLHVVDVVDAVGAVRAEREQEFCFSVYPKRSGRTFDADRDDDWLRIGALVGRLHAAAAHGAAEHRMTCAPEESTARFLDDLEQAELVPPDLAGEFYDLADAAVERIAPLFDGVALQRLHGDCHRGNILDRAEQGLLIIDFDDMMIGPAVQDLWLLLPGRVADSRRELALLLEGYERFQPFDRRTVALIEPLRLMRMIYYLAWQALQRRDLRFLESFPQWGGRAFWEREIEDLRTQLRVIEDDPG